MSFVKRTVVSTGLLLLLSFYGKGHVVLPIFLFSFFLLPPEFYLLL